MVWPSSGLKLSHTVIQMS